MEDFSSAPVSTMIDTEVGPSASGGGVPTPADLGADTSKPASAREDLEAVFKEANAKPEATDDKPKPEPELKTKEEDPKPDTKATPAPKEEVPKDDAKADPAPKDGQAAPAKEAQPEETKDFRGPPKKFLPDSHEVWRNVPRSVRRDIDTMVREHEAEIGQARETTERYETLRPYDELARTNGRDLRESLERVNQVENLMQRNPLAGLNAILMEIGPRKPDGQPFSLFEVAQHIAQAGPEGYQRMVQVQPEQQQQQQREDPRLLAVQQELEDLKTRQVARDIIDPFKAGHPRYDELKQDIAFFLSSGKISQTLSPVDRLAAAYDMAVRINPASHVAATTANDDLGPGTHDRRADPDFSGSKSIKSSPGSITDDVEDQAKGGESVRDSLLKEMRRLTR